MSRATSLIAHYRVVLLAGFSFLFACFSAFAGRVEHPDDTKPWKRMIEQRISEQLRGNTSAWHDTFHSWKEFWTNWYSFLRNPGNTGLPWPGSEFKTRDDMIRYIKSRLKAHHLPTYEQT